MQFIIARFYYSIAFNSMTAIEIRIWSNIWAIQLSFLTSVIPWRIASNSGFLRTNMIHQLFVLHECLFAEITSSRFPWLVWRQNPRRIGSDGIMHGCKYNIIRTRSSRRWRRSQCQNGHFVSPVSLFFVFHFGFGFVFFVDNGHVYLRHLFISYWNYYSINFLLLKYFLLISIISNTIFCIKFLHNSI